MTLSPAIRLAQIRHFPDNFPVSGKILATAAVRRIDHTTNKKTQET
jgi:hypothetical protein